MPSARVLAVAPGSPAADAGLAAGDEVVTVNGDDLRDVIAYQLHVDGAHVELEVRRGGLERLVTVDKGEGEPLGVELASAVFDRVQTCDNHCPFCFIYQLPKGMRRSLYLKDDDYRLSFLYGNFTTLTRFTEADLERVVTERLGPLYVSIHATDPDVRTRLLRNRRGATSLRWLELLLDAGIEVHGQVVVCPGINDAAVLDDTLLGVLDRFGRLATLGVVPLGVSAHNREDEMRPHTTTEARAVVELIEEWQARYLAALGRRLVYASDEYYLLADLPFPALDAYDGCPQHENGIGMARTFEAEVRAALAGDAIEGTGPRSGFFAWVDGAPASGYRAPRHHTNPHQQLAGSRALRAREPANLASTNEPAVAIITGEMGAAVLEPLLASLPGNVRLLPVANRFFGGNIGVTGLLAGADVADALADTPEHDRYLLPDVVLSRGRFLDGTSVADLPRMVEIVPTDGAALVRALAS
jgi:putative radical SAM enzyme (TIGR03279 family)